MTQNERVFMGRKAESIYTAARKNCSAHQKRNRAAEARHSLSCFEEYMKRNEAARACYVSINGIMMPVLSA